MIFTNSFPVALDHIKFIHKVKNHFQSKLKILPRHETEREIYFHSSYDASKVYRIEYY